MAHEIYDLVESEKIIRLYNPQPSVYGNDCRLAWDRLQPGWIKVSARENVYIRLLFGAINKNGVELA